MITKELARHAQNWTYLLLDIFPAPCKALKVKLKILFERKTTKVDNNSPANGSIYALQSNKKFGKLYDPLIDIT
jgi:hypothetical protein